MNKKKMICVAVSVSGIMLALNAHSAAFHMMGDRASSRLFIPQPRLLYPMTEEVDLSGKDYLQFKWSPHEGDPTLRDHYEFRLYDGYEMTASTLIMKSSVPQNVYTIDIKSELFRNGRIYTWSLRQVYTGSDKSRRSYHSFRVIGAAK